MGDIIRREAPIHEIIEDVRTTFTKAIQKGGLWREAATEKLAAGLAAVSVIEAKLTEANQKVAPSLAAVPVADDLADDLISRIADDAWNLLGRPATDPFYDLLFPGGVSAYTIGPDEDQPTRMELLASLLESGVHPTLDREFSLQAAKQLRDTIDFYQAAIDAGRPYRLQIQLYGKMKATLARGLQLSLASMKRRLRSEGFTEEEIHSVIPDRPRATTPMPPRNDPDE